MTASHVPAYLGDALRLIAYARRVPGYRFRSGEVRGAGASTDPTSRETAAPPNEVLAELDARGWLDVTAHGPIGISDAGRAALRRFKAQEARDE